MPFQKGQSGNPNGRPKSSKLFNDMLRLAINGADGDMAELRKIADKLVEKAVAGDIQAIKEVADRLDGKPMQAIEASVDLSTDPLTEMIDWVAKHGKRPFNRE